MTSRDAELWDAQAARFDDEPDHGLHDPLVRDAWRSLLRSVLPPSPGRVADLGCGTGTLSLLLVEGSWSTGAGLTTTETVALVEGAGLVADPRGLDDPAYWGRPISDERYV